MRAIILTFLTTAVTLIGVNSDLVAQKVAIKNKRNSVEIYFPVKHFFDGTETNWLLIKPYEVFKVDNQGHVIGIDKKFGLPFTFGLQYNRSLLNSDIIRFSIAEYYMDYGDIHRDKKPGEVITRAYGLFSVGYLYQILRNNHTSLQANAELNYRYGYEMIHIYYPNWFEARWEVLDLSDIGLSAGFRVEQSLPYNFLISGEAKYTRFVYRASKGIDFFGQHKDTTSNTLTIKFGIGYRF